MRTSQRWRRLGGGGCERGAAWKIQTGTDRELFSVNRYSRRWQMMVLICVVGAMLATVTGCSVRDTKTQVTSRDVTTFVVLESVASTDAPTSTSARPTTTTIAPTTTTTASTTTTNASTTTTMPVPSGVSWEDALRYVGQEVTIVGPVVGTRYASSSSGSPTFLNIGLQYPDPGRFQVVI